MEVKKVKRKVTLIKFEEDNIYANHCRLVSNQIIYSDVEEIPTESSDSEEED